MAFMKLKKLKLIVAVVSCRKRRAHYCAKYSIEKDKDDDNYNSNNAESYTDLCLLVFDSDSGGFLLTDNAENDCNDCAGKRNKTAEEGNPAGAYSTQCRKECSAVCFVSTHVKQPPAGRKSVREDSRKVGKKKCLSGSKQPACP